MIAMLYDELLMMPYANEFITMSTMMVIGVMMRMIMVTTILR